MIQANELRIGNWLEFHLYGNKEIRQIDNTDFEFISDNNLRCANPIPLTEEWLVKFGFESLILIVHGITFIFEKIGSDFICHIEDAIILEIQYVHTLQNLYFSLTGQELTLKK